MSTQTVEENTGSQAHIQTDISKIFIRNNVDLSFNYTNSTGGDLTFLAGTVFGRIHATGLVLPLKSAAVDGSELPVGVLMHDITVVDTASAVLTMCVGGEIAEEKIILDGADTLDTVIDSRRIRDLIALNTVGILLVPGTELTGFDNA
jgi:hypothetical protein